VQAAIAEAVQLMFFHTFNKDERKAELESLLRDCYGTLFGMVADGDRETQIGSSLTILKLIQLSMVPKYSGVYDLLVGADHSVGYCGDLQSYADFARGFAVPQ
jgi:hypothetical protein